MQACSQFSGKKVSMITLEYYYKFFGFLIFNLSKYFSIPHVVSVILSHMKGQCSFFAHMQEIRSTYFPFK